jgi:hypothetical protein
MNRKLFDRPTRVYSSFVEATRDAKATLVYCQRTLPLKKMDKGVWVVKSEVEGEKECNERLLYSERKEERTALGVLCTRRWPTTKYVR